MDIFNPATSQLIASVETDNETSLKEKFQSAKSTQPNWNALGFSKRKEILSRFCDLLEKDSENLAQILTSEMGKPISQARGEVRAVQGRLKFFLEHTEENLKPTLMHEEGSLTEKITYEPLGVVLNISAWNYPYFVGANVFMPALLTGNALLYKPSEFSTLSGIEIVKNLHEAGVPKEICQIILGKGDIGAKALDLPIDGVFFTGSQGTGQKINEAVAHKLVRVQLELGGKDPVYVCDDVINVKASAEGTADGAFYNAGQSCCAIERLYVHEKIYDEFVSHFVNTVKNFVIGDPTSENTYIGALTRKEQISFLLDQIKDATKKGAHIECGGTPSDLGEKLFNPTVLTNVNSDMKVMRDESFGPIIGIQKVKNDEEAISLMNDTDYGLTSGVYSSSKDRAENIMRNLQAGSVYWNCCDRVSPNLPWTGWKQSGLGSTLSNIGIQAFLQPKAWHLRAP